MNYHEALPFHEQLTSNLYATVALDLGEQDIKDAVAAFLSFTQLPPEYKQLANYCLDERRNTRFGWMPHARAAGDDENAAIFHHGLLSQQVAEARLPRLPGELQTFLDIAHQIHVASIRSAKECLAKAAPDVPTLLGVFFPEHPNRSPWNTHLRFIAYEASPDRRLTTGHFDQAAGTLAIAESHAGLHIGHDEHDLNPVVREAKESLFFTGLGWKKLFRTLGMTSSIEPAWHNVLEQDDHGVSDQYLRWAIVNFINPADLQTVSTRAETHAGVQVA